MSKRAEHKDHPTLTPNDMAKYKVEFDVTCEQEGMSKELSYYLNKYIEAALPPTGHEPQYEAGYINVEELA